MQEDEKKVETTPTKKPTTKKPQIGDEFVGKMKTGKKEFVKTRYGEMSERVYYGKIIDRKEKAKPLMIFNTGVKSEPDCLYYCGYDANENLILSCKKSVKIHLLTTALKKEKRIFYYCYSKNGEIYINKTTHGWKFKNYISPKVEKKIKIAAEKEKELNARKENTEYVPEWGLDDGSPIPGILDQPDDD